MSWVMWSASRPPKSFGQVARELPRELPGGIVVALAVLTAPLPAGGQLLIEEPAHLRAKRFLLRRELELHGDLASLGGNGQSAMGNGALGSRLPIADCPLPRYSSTSYVFRTQVPWG